MEKFIKKWLPLAFFGIILLNFLVYLTNTYFNYRKAKHTESKLMESKRKNENLEQANKEAKDFRQSKLEEAQIKKIEQELAGFQGEYEIYEWDDKKGYLGIQGIDEVPHVTPGGNEEEGILHFSDTTKKHFSRITQDIDDWLNNNRQLEPLEGLSESFNCPDLIRNNCILYGAPGTGKTEFVKELNHILINRYGENPEEVEEVVDPNNPNYGIQREESEQNHSQQRIKKPRIPIFEIKGATLMSTGKEEPKTFEKLIITIRQAKQKFFKNPDWDGKVGEESQFPYIVFLEEADQAKNPLTYNPQTKNNLEELKNFFSTGSESKGLLGKSQDRNSIVIAATNNYETVDPAMKRWGRLGISLNFTWNPETIQAYSRQPLTQINWPQINGDDHYCWKFSKNEDREFLFELAKKINFHNFESEFVQKTNQILQQWNTWDEKERDDFAYSRLGLESKVWCNSCQAETNPEKASQKQERLKNALRNATDQTQRDQITKQEADKKLTECGHQAKPICNWLLHYLHTFFIYYEKQDLENFDNPEKIQRYQFNEKRLLRERINQLRIDLNELGQDTLNTFGEELRRISNQLDKIHNIYQQGTQNQLSNINNNLARLAQEIRACQSLTSPVTR